MSQLELYFSKCTLARTFAAKLFFGACSATFSEDKFDVQLCAFLEELSVRLWRNFYDLRCP